MKNHKGITYFQSQITGRWIVDGVQFYCAGYKTEDAAIKAINKGN